MRKIVISTAIEHVAEKYRDEVLIDKRFSSVLFHPLSRLKRLKDNLHNSIFKEYTNKDGVNNFKHIKDNANMEMYVEKVIERLPLLLNLKPSEFAKQKSDFDAILPPDRLKAKLTCNNKNPTPFYEKIVAALQYTLVRQYILPKYLGQIGVKTCVYCNANYAITDSRNRAYYDVDHWKPKSIYPYLAISFYNMQPTCHSCNINKGNDDSHLYFGLYSEDENANLGVFHFSIAEDEISEYLLDGDINHLSIKFGASRHATLQLAKDMDEKLHITDLYSKHLDVAEEIIRKAQYYNSSFIESLKPLFKDSDLMPSNTDVMRFILGMYILPEDIHKRPLNKMMRDIYFNCVEKEEL